MPTLRRTIHPVVRVLDAAKGIVEYVASDESLDCYNEVVRAAGAQFNRFQKNAPFVDSHNYESIDCLLGRVVDFKVSGRSVVEAVQWAIDVPSNTLAKFGFDMTVAGYLKAVSIGFMPVNAVTRYDSDPSDFNEALEDLNLSAGADVRTIYLAWEQLELSTCVIGANPNAVAKAYRDGVLTDSTAQHISSKYPQFAALLERAISPASRRTYSSPGNPGQSRAVTEMLSALGKKNQTSHQPTPSPTMKKDNFLEEFSQLARSTKSQFEDIELSRRNGSTSELERILRRAFKSAAQEKQASYGNPIARYFEQHPERRMFWNGIARRLTGTLKSGTPEHKALQDAFGGTTADEVMRDTFSKQRAASGVDLQDQFGYGLLLSVPVADEVYDLLLHYGAYKYLGLRRMTGQYTAFAAATGFPTAVFITLTQQGAATIPADTTLTGNSTVVLANTIASLITASREWLNDQKVDLSEVIFSKFVQGTAQRIDYGCFQGNGQDDVNNGMTKGIFFDPAIPVVKTAAGTANINALKRSDFVNVIAQVNPAALQRMDEQPPRWYISPVFIPLLLGLVDPNGHCYLLKTPAETGGEWLLLGFPVTWAGAAPAVNAVGNKVFAFGNPDAYIVGLHENFEIALSENGQTFANNETNFRSIGRGKSMLRDATGFVTLQLA